MRNRKWIDFRNIEGKLKSDYLQRNESAYTQIYADDGKVPMIEVSDRNGNFSRAFEGTLIQVRAF